MKSPKSTHFPKYKQQEEEDTTSLVSVMAPQHQEQEPTAIDSSPSSTQQHYHNLFSSYLGISFTVFLGLLPKSSISYVSKLQSHNRALSLKLSQAEEQLKQLLSRRKEDSKANARVVEIFASHRHGWQQEEKRLLHQIDAGVEEIAHLRAKVEEFEKLEDELKGKVEELKREVSEREEMLNFVTRRGDEEEEEELEDSGGGGGGYGGSGDYGGGEYYGDMGSRFGKVRVNDEGNIDVRSMEDCYMERGGGVHQNVDEFGGTYGRNNGFNPEFSNSASKFWAERASLWQDVQYEPVESVYDMKHYVARRESPWKVDGDSSGVSSKLKLLEQELHNLERVGTGDPSKAPSLMRKQAKRYQALAGKIDDLCRRMQASDPCEPNLSPEFRTQRQTEFLLEAFRLQQRASETSQKLTALQAESGKGYYGDDVECQAKLATRRSFSSIRNNFREIQRNLEIWLARIIGDVEGILADGASRVKDYYISRYPFVQ